MWGEIEDKSSMHEKLPDKANPLLYSLMDQARKPDCLSIYQIGSQMHENKEINLSSMNAQMLYAMTLHEYIDDMTNIMNDAELAAEYNLVMPSEAQNTNLPEPAPAEKVAKARKPLNFLEKQYNEFSVGSGKISPNLSEVTRRHLEVQSMATILAHVGFEDTSENVLNVLTDTFESFMKNICNELRVTNDFLRTNRPSGFPDIIEQVLRNCNLGGIRGILDFCENRLNKYETVLHKDAQKVFLRYENLLTPNNMETDTNSERNHELENGDIPEVHFTTMDGEEGYLQPFLESGFQMLNSLEEGQYTA